MVEVIMNVGTTIETEQRLAVSKGEDRVEPADKLLAHAKAQNPNEKTVQSKLATLDNTIGSFVAGELTVVSGPTGSGKTTLCQTFTMAFTEQHFKPIWFSFEMPWKQFLSHFHPDYLPHFYGPAKLSQKSIDWIAERIWEAKLKYGCSVVFIDHLHFLLDLARVRYASIEIGEVVRKLKLLALKHNLILFLIAHTVKTREEREFVLGDVRDSGLIEAEADNVLYIWRDKKHDNVSVLKVAKNRKHGIVEKKIPLIFTCGNGVSRYYERFNDDTRRIV